MSYYIGWIVSSGNTQYLTLSKVVLKDGITDIICSMVINANFTWKIVVGKKELKSSLAPFDILTQRVVSVSGVIEVVRYIESCHLCVGNNDKRYFELQAARKGKFMDSTGIAFIYGSHAIISYLLTFRIKTGCLL